MEHNTPHLSDKTRRQLLRYLVSGFSAFALEYGLYLILVKGLQVYYVTAGAIVYTLVFLFSFIINRRWSFESTGHAGRQLILYGLLFAFNLVVGNLVLLKFFSETLGMGQLIAPFFKTGCIVCWNFLAYKYIIYK